MKCLPYASLAIAAPPLIACLVYLCTGDIPPMWLAGATFGAVVIASALAIVHAWWQS